MSILKKLWMVVPFIRDAATPLGASLVTTRHCLRYSPGGYLSNMPYIAEDCISSLL